MLFAVGHEKRESGHVLTKGCCAAVALAKLVDLQQIVTGVGEMETLGLPGMAMPDSKNTISVWIMVAEDARMQFSAMIRIICGRRVPLL